MPSCSPRLGGRVVADTENERVGIVENRCLTSVDLPTPEGPLTTNNVPMVSEDVTVFSSDGAMVEQVEVQHPHNIGSP